MIHKVIDLVVASELIEKQLNEIKESRTRAEAEALTGYIKQLEKIHNKTFPELLISELLWSTLIVVFKRIGREINITPKDGIEAQKRLQEVYNLLRPFIDFIETKTGVIDEELEEKRIREISPDVVIEKLDTMEKLVKSFFEIRPNIVAITSPEELEEVGDRMIKDLESSGCPEDKIQKLKDLLNRVREE